MPHLLTNENFEIRIDLPDENYNFSRFDWSGKISEVKFKNILLSSTERYSDQQDEIFGKGFYNEFGIDTALGFEQTEIGGWFHKIGIGLLKKEGDQYLFHKKYLIRPAVFKIKADEIKYSIQCQSEPIRGYAYSLHKEIRLLNDGFSIHYNLKNKGEKNIVTDEYGHNFTAVNNEEIGENYTLTFPFEIKPENFTESVNPEKKVCFNKNQIGFLSVPNEEFFFSNLSGGRMETAQWELTNHASGIAISESGNFQTDKVNLWGSKHVISPELFFKISLQPGESVQWQRTYTVNCVR